MELSQEQVVEALEHRSRSRSAASQNGDYWRRQESRSRSSDELSLSGWRVLA